MSLDAWRVLATDAAHTVAFFGDSTWEGGRYQNAPWFVGDLMRQRWGRGSLGMIGTWLQDYWGFAGSPTEAGASDTWDRGPYGGALLDTGVFRLNTSSDIATFTVSGGARSAIVLHMVDGPSAGNFSVSIDGGAFANVSETWAQAGAVKRITVAGPIAATLRIRGANAAGTATLAYLIGAEPKISGESGAVCHGLGSAAAFSSMLVRTTAGDWGAWLDAVQPAVACFMFTNDVTALWNPTNFQARVETFVARVRANNGEPILAAFGEQSSRSTTDQATLRGIIATVAAAQSCPTLDFYAIWGDAAASLAAGYTHSDGTHPTVKGHRSMATHLWGLLGETRTTAVYVGP